MSDASANGGSKQREAKAYLHDVLELNPIWQSGQILQRRRDLLGISSQQSDATLVQANDDAIDQQRLLRMRERGRERLKHLQTKFFELSESELSAALDELTPEKFPDLAATVARLRVAAQHRDTRVALFHEPNLDSNMIHALGWILVSPPSDAGFSRESYIQSLTTSKKVRLARESANFLSQNYPLLFQLERDWLTTIANQTMPSSGTLGNAAWKPKMGTSHWILVVIVIGILVRVLGALVRNN